MEPVNKPPIPAYKDTNLEDLQGEEWVDIPGLDGYYQLSNFGRIKRMERIIHDVLGRPRTFPCIIKLAQINKDRNMLMKDWSKRLQATLQVENQKYHFQISRLVYYCFVQKFDMDNKLLVVSAKNGNGLDVYPENLELLTYELKNHKSYDTGRQLSHFQTNPFKLIEANMHSAATNSRVVSQYGKDGTFKQKFKNSIEAARQLGIKYERIYYAIKHLDYLLNDHYWRFGDANKINQKELQSYVKARQRSFRKKRGKTVTQFDLGGNAIACFSARSVAARITGINHKQISENIKGKVKHAGGFVWRSGNLINNGASIHSYILANAKESVNDVSLLNCIKRDIRDRGEFSVGIKVTQFNLEGQPIAQYNTLQEAATAVKCRYQRIALAISGKIKIVGGYLWKKGHFIN